MVYANLLQLFIYQVGTCVEMVNGIHIQRQKNAELVACSLLAETWREVWFMVLHCQDKIYTTDFHLWIAKLPASQIIKVCLTT